MYSALVITEELGVRICVKYPYLLSENGRQIISYYVRGSDYVPNWLKHSIMHCLLKQVQPHLPCSLFLQSCGQNSDAKLSLSPPSETSMKKKKEKDFLNQASTET